METCLRGFSFMAETKVEATDLQYIEGGELERMWKISRRQRLKEQEQKVWEEFVKEHDVVKVVFNDDPYQFLQQLPESCLKEMMESELVKSTKEVEQEINDLSNQGTGDFHQSEEIQHTVTFADDGEIDGDIFNIFADENELHSSPSGPEDEFLNDSTVCSPCTVRERDSENNSPLPLLEKDKSSQNVSDVIESSIYCAKVKDLRLKIYDEIQEIMSSLDRQDVMTIEREEVTRMCRRSAEFSTRFNRIYMYQLQRQMQDVKRNTLHSLPFAKHTQFHAQMVRVASLHQHLLQAFQVFHKSLDQTACVRESASMLHSLALAGRDVTAYCAAVPTPNDLNAAKLIYDDEMLAICDKLDVAVCEHSLRVADFLSTTDNTSRSPSSKSKGKRKTSKATKSIPESRLSMYSFDTLRLNAKSTSSKDNQSSGTSKGHGALSTMGTKKQNEKKPRSPKRSPRNRRPLMRAGGAQTQRTRTLLPKDNEIATMVQTVETCTSSHMSREASPHTTSRSVEAPRRKPINSMPWTARTSDTNSPRKSPTNSPRQKVQPLSSVKPKLRRGSPNRSRIIKAVSSIQSDAQDSARSNIQITSVPKIKCANKGMKAGKNVAKIDKNHEQTKYSDIATHDLDSVKDLGSVGTFDSKVFDSAKNFDSRKDFDSEIETAPYSKVRKESNGRVLASPWPKSIDERDGSTSDREKTNISRVAPARCEVTRLLKQLCSSDGSGNRSERVSGAKNAQLLCVSGGSPRQSSTPQLLRILEETIQKKAPKPMYSKTTAKDPDRFRMTFNIPEKAADNLFQYRTKFVQHMLESSMYANSAVGKPWEIIGSISEKLIDELLMGCAREMQIRGVVNKLYNSETKGF